MQCTLTNTEMEEKPQSRHQSTRRKSHFSFGWSGQEEQEPVQKRGKKRFDQNNDNMIGIMGGEQKPVHTSVRVTKNPGGQSNIVFGTDDSNYEHYRK